MIFWKFLIEIAAKIVVRRVPIFLVSSLRILGLRVDIRSKDKLKLILRNEWTRFARSRYPIIKDAYRIIRIRCKNPLLPSTVQSYYKLKPRLDAGIAWGIIGNRESLENVKTIPRLLPNYPRIRIHTCQLDVLRGFSIRISCIWGWFNHVPTDLSSSSIYQYTKNFKIVWAIRIQSRWWLIDGKFQIARKYRDASFSNGTFFVKHVGIFSQRYQLRSQFWSFARNVSV